MIRIKLHKNKTLRT